MKQLVKHLAILVTVACLASVGLTNSAKADFVIRLDNSPNPTGYPTFTSTTNTIKVYVTTDGNASWQLVDSQVLDTVSGTHDFCWVGTEQDFNITGVKITTNGDNWFWLDQFEIWSSNDSDCHADIEDHEEGVDNQNGYCFSTDSADGDSAYCTKAGSEGRTGSGPSYSAMWWDINI